MMTLEMIKEYMPEFGQALENGIAKEVAKKQVEIDELKAEILAAIYLI